MRLALGLAALTIVAAAPSLAAVKLSEQERNRIGCAFAVSQLRSTFEAKSSDGIFEDQPVLAGQVSGLQAADAIVQAWNVRGPTNLFSACPELRKRLPPGAQFATDEHRAEVQKLFSARPIMIAGYSAPLVSEDGQQIIFGWKYSCPGLCGGGFVGLYRRTGDGWSKPAVLAMWMS